MIGIDLQAHVLLIHHHRISLVTGRKTIKEAPLSSETERTVVNGYHLHMLLTTPLWKSMLARPRPCGVYILTEEQRLSSDIGLRKVTVNWL